MTSQLKTNKNWPNPWLEHIAKSRQIYLQQEVEKSPDGSTSCFKYEELIDDWLDLAVLEAEKTRTSTEEQTCRRCRIVQRTTQP